MKLLKYTLSILILLFLYMPLKAYTYSAIKADTVKTDTIKKSLPRELNHTIGKAQLKLKYHSPGVRGRIIWGGLVAYNQVWVTGAHMATSIEVNLPINIGGKNLPAGKYALFTIPNKEEWTVIINKNWEQHLTDDYREADDLVRISVKPQTVEHLERLTYNIENTSATEGVLSMHWEKVKITFPILIKNL